MAPFLSEHISDVWSKYFFSHFNTLFPLLSQDELKQQDDPLLNFAVFALGALYSSFEYHSSLFEKAEYIFNILTTQYTIPTVQVIQKQKGGDTLYF